MFKNRKAMIIGEGGCPFCRSTETTTIKAKCLGCGSSFETLVVMGQNHRPHHCIHPAIIRISFDPCPSCNELNYAETDTQGVCLVCDGLKELTPNGRIIKHKNYNYRGKECRGSGQEPTSAIKSFF